MTQLKTQSLDKHHIMRPKSISNRKAPSECLEKQEWYHGLLPRQDINEMLTKEGDFIVRDTEYKGKSNMVISVFWDGKQRHVILHKHEATGQFAVDPAPDSPSFASISLMIKHYQETRSYLHNKFQYRLLNPIGRRPWELSHDNIKLTKKLGEGAFGEVYLGELTDIKTGETNKVAIKRSHANKLLTKPQLLELMAEARTMSRLHHKNIVKLYGVAAFTQPVMIVMEIVSGGSLDSYLKKKTGVTTPIDKWNYCSGAAEGCAYLHTRDPPQMHRDLAARNCLITESGMVKVADFGLATSGEDAKLSMDAKVPIRWLAPEVLRDKRFTLKADVWAYGIMCWEIYMDGEEPYPGMRAMEVAKAVVMEGYRMDLNAIICMQPEMRAIIMSTWKAAAEERPTFTDVVKMFATFSQTLPGTIPPSMPSPVRPSRSKGKSLYKH